MRLAPALAALVAMAAVAAGAVQVRETVTTSPSATIPITLAAGTAGSTTLGSSATSATTTGVSLPALGNAQALKVIHGSAAWKVQVQLVSVTGTGGLDTITVVLSGGTTQTQVAVTLGSVTQSIGTAVTLPSAGPDIQVLAAGGCVGTCTFTLRILVTPSGSSVPVLSLPYSLAVT